MNPILHGLVPLLLCLFPTTSSARTDCDPCRDCCPPACCESSAPTSPAPKGECCPAASCETATVKVAAPEAKGCGTSCDR